MTNPALLGQVRRKLNITWEDDETTAQVEEIIASAIPTMIRKLGIADSNFDFSEPGDENRLFKNYCLYEWNHCANEFDTNYENDIAQVQAKHDVQHYLAESEGSADEEN